MGWTFTHKPPNESLRTFFEREWGSDNGRGIVDFAVAGFNTAYAAYRTHDGRIIGIVVSVTYRPRDYYNFGYKAVDECQGPYEAKCPERILNLLTPLSDREEDRYAREWRERCQAYHAKRRQAIALRKQIGVGDTVKLQGTRYDGYPAKVIEVKRGSVTVIISGWQYRIPLRLIASVEKAS
jgi:hypothetical protein